MFEEHPSHISPHIIITRLNPHSKQKEQYPNPPPQSPYGPVLFTLMDDVICIREERNIKTGFLNPTAPLSLLHHPLQQILILLLILILLVCAIVLLCFVFTQNHV